MVFDGKQISWNGRDIEITEEADDGAITVAEGGGDTGINSGENDSEVGGEVSGQAGTRSVE